MLEALKSHWREYFCEAFGLGMFMVSACVFGAVLFHPVSPLISLNEILRNVLMGIAMGATAVAIICSPFGKRSGAHINPAMTLTFLRLGKIKLWDTIFYISAHFAGATAGVLFAWLVLGEILKDSAVNFVVTMPGKYGAGVAFFAEFIISFFLMLMVLVSTNSIKLSRFTPYFAGLLVAIYISLEAPFSGMSMNPARTFASAAVAGHWDSIWLYFIAPPMAMLLAAEVFMRIKGMKSILCAKLRHDSRPRCIFNCDFGEMKDEFIEVTKQPHLFPNGMQIF